MQRVSHSLGKGYESITLAMGALRGGFRRLIPELRIKESKEVRRWQV
jgi:hypothetical protein